MRYYLFILFLPPILSYSQTSVVIHDIHNPLLYFNTRLTKPPPNYGIIDTANICRNKTNKIRSTTVYYFQSEEDSFKHRRYTYSPKGFIVNDINNHIFEIYKKEGIDPYSTILPCPHLKPFDKALSGKTIRKRYFLQRESIIRKYDSLGYLSQYTSIERGIVRRYLMTHAFGGIPRVDIFYNYSDNYRKVTITEYYSLKIRIDKRSFERTYVSFGSNGNLLSEMTYYHHPNGEVEFRKGFKYFYKYYEK